VEINEQLKYFTALFQIRDNYLKYLRAVILYRLKRKVVFPETRIKLYNSKFKTRKNSMDIAHLSNFYERATTKLLLKLNPKVFVDVGAHVGRYSIILAKNGSRVVSIEPSKDNFRQLTENIQLNNLQNSINALNIGCSDIKETRNLFFNPTQEGLTSFIDKGEDSIKELHELRKLDEICENMGPIDLIKIDVEGFELNVLKGAEDILKNKSPKLVIEITDYRQEKEIREFLNKFNYSCKQVLDLRNFIFEK